VKVGFWTLDILVFLVCLPGHSIITYIWIMQTSQVQCRLEVKGVLQKTFPLLSDCGRFVLNMKKWKYTTYITSM